MSLEDDLFNTFKYSNLSGSPMDPTTMISTLLRRVEVSMLTQMQARIKARISELKGTPKSDPTMDPFVILGVSMTSTREEVDKAYKAKARAAHPDCGGCHEDMVRVNAAYEAIRLFKGWKAL